MQFLLFVLSLVVVVGMVGVSAWALAQAVIYLCRTLHQAMTYAVRCVEHLLIMKSRALAWLKGLWVALEQAWVAGFYRLIESCQAWQARKHNSVHASKDSVSVSMPVEVIDWSVYDKPTYLRKATALVW